MRKLLIYLLRTSFAEALHLAARVFLEIAGVAIFAAKALWNAADAAGRDLASV